MSLSRVLKQPRQWVYEDVLEEENVQIEPIVIEVDKVLANPKVEEHIEALVEDVSTMHAIVDIEAIKAEALARAREEVFAENVVFIENLRMEYSHYISKLHEEQMLALNDIKAQAHQLAIACTETLLHEKLSATDQTALLNLIGTECERHKDDKFTHLRLSRKLRPHQKEIEALLSGNTLKLSWVEGTSDTCIFEKDGAYYDVSLKTKFENLKHLFMTR